MTPAIAQCDAVERRTGCRVQLALPVRIETRGAVAIHAETRDVSAGGFLLFTSENLPTGSEIEYIVSIPNFRAVRLRCAGKVLRCAGLTPDGVEIAVTMDECLSVDADL